MNTEEAFSNSTYEDEVHVAEREFAAFLDAVKKLFGPEPVRLAAKDWLDESDLMDSAPRSTGRDWRAVTVAASDRMANRLIVEADHQMSFTASPFAPVTIDTTASPSPSSNCFDFTLLV